MGTDYLQLLDRRTAEIIIGGDELDLSTLVDLRTPPLEPPVWRNYWDDGKQSLVDFDLAATAQQRLRAIIERGSRMEEVKDDLLHQLCNGGGFLYLDYWGCFTEVFSVEPPGATTWEDFTAPMRNIPASKEEKTESSGRYLLTSINVDSILRSLEAHRHELQIMGESQIERLRQWQVFCTKHTDFCVVYQIDF